jgi:phage shock protein A
MSENAWMLEGVDPETLNMAAAEAARRGMSVNDYLAELLTPLLEGGPEFVRRPAEHASEPPSAPPPLPEHFAIRHQLTALSRRLNLAVGGLDSTAQALDRSMTDLSERVLGAEALASETAQTLTKALGDVDDAFASVRARFAEGETTIDKLRDRHEEAREALAERCGGIDRKLSRLGEEQTALKQALAADFCELTHQSALQIESGLDELRAAADAAAEHANQAAERLMTELRALRQNVDARLTQSAAETRQRMQAAFAESAARMDALGARMSAHEGAGDQFQTQLAEYQEAAGSLRQAHTALAADVAHTTHEMRTAIDSIHAGLADEISGVRDQHGALLARQRLADAALSTFADDIEKLRNEASARAIADEGVARATLARAQTEWDERFSALSARQGNHERNSAEAIQVMHAEVDRVEACTLVSLGKLADDMADIREAQGAVLARLKFLDGALGNIDAGAQTIDARLAHVETALQGRALDHAFDERILRLEAAAESVETAQALAVLREQLTVLSADVAAHRADPNISNRIEELGARLAASDSKMLGVADRVADLVAMVRSLGDEKTAEAQQTRDRVRQLELAAEASGAQTADALTIVAQRATAFEARQDSAFDVLRAEIAAFVTANDERLQALESEASQPDLSDFAAEFEILRRRIEERVTDVETRSVHALEQIADTMAVLEARFVRNREIQTRSA